MKLNLLSLLLFCSILLKAQVSIRYNDTPGANNASKIVEPFNAFVSQNMLSQLDSLEPEINNEFTIFVTEKGATYAILNGLLNVYFWENQTWKNLYKGKFGGHNFDSYNFMYLDELYSFGGYGYWTHNNNLIKFNKQKGEWEFIGKLNTQRSLIRPFVARVDNRLIIAGGRYESESSILVNEEVFEFDLNSLEVTKRKAKSVSEIFLQVYEKSSTQIGNYIIAQYYAQNKINILIYDIREEKYLINKTVKLKLGKAALSLVKNEELFFYQTDSTVESVKLNALLMSQESPTINSGPNYQLLPIILTVIALILLLLALRKVQSNKKVEKSGRETKNNYGGINQLLIEEYISGLREFEGQVITTQELDSIFKLDSFQIDSQRARRSQIIKSINSFSTTNYSYTIILRVKDKNDKRYVKYQINKRP